MSERKRDLDRLREKLAQGPRGVGLIGVSTDLLQVDGAGALLVVLRSE